MAKVELATQRIMVQNGFMISELLPEFHHYHLDDAPDLTSCSMVIRRVEYHPTAYASKLLEPSMLTNFYGEESPLQARYIRDLTHEPIDSKADPDIDPAGEYSNAGATWHPLPKGISVIGSRYALVLDRIEPTNIEINLEKYVVGIGHSRGKNASEYLQGRIDKGCLTAASASSVSLDPPLKKFIKFSAKLLEPYAVLLR